MFDAIVQCVAGSYTVSTDDQFGDTFVPLPKEPKCDSAAVS